MIGNKRVACVIPARLQSTRFPRKMLSYLKGKPLLQWIWDKACRMSCFDDVVIAIDSPEVAALVAEFQGRAIMTSLLHRCGTDRLIEVMQGQEVVADIWVNWQGDEPLISEAMIKALLQTSDQEGADVWTLQVPLSSDKALEPHAVKVVCNQHGHALYFSRYAIPFCRDAGLAPQYHKHVGLYAYTHSALAQIAQMAPCAIEEAEQLEQLRWLYYGLKIQVHTIAQEVQGVDLPEHLAALELMSESFSL